jgi:hypothetical protein
MGQIDWDKERERLDALYAGKEDAELEEMAEEAESLTEAAKAALRSEMLRRGLSPPRENTAPSTPSQKDQPPPVMVRRYRDLPDASIAKSILDSAGIESYLIDGNMVRLDWFYSNLVGGVKLFVRQQDAEAADKLLSQGVPEKFDVEEVGEYQQPRCPHCQSWDVTLDGLERHLTYATLFFGLPIPITKRGWKCRSCGHEWSDPPRTAPGTTE